MHDSSLSGPFSDGARRPLDPPHRGFGTPRAIVVQFSDEKSHFLVGKLLTEESVFLENGSHKPTIYEEGNGPWLRR
jgi:hypothetical protein